MLICLLLLYPQLQLNANKPIIGCKHSLVFVDCIIDKNAKLVPFFGRKVSSLLQSDRKFLEFCYLFFSHCGNTPVANLNLRAGRSLRRAPQFHRYTQTQSVASKSLRKIFALSQSLFPCGSRSNVHTIRRWYLLSSLYFTLPVACAGRTHAPRSICLQAHFQLPFNPKNLIIHFIFSPRKFAYNQLFQRMPQTARHSLNAVVSCQKRHGTNKVLMAINRLPRASTNRL